MDLAQATAVMATLAYLAMRLRVFRRLVALDVRPGDKVLFALAFGGLAILGTYLGIPVQGAIANSRVVGAAVAGLLGGPWVGLAAGAIGGAHRYALGGFTAFACGLSTSVEGVLAGLLHRRYPTRRLDWRLGLVAGLALETLQMGIVLLIARPFAEAWALVRVVSLPMILTNSAAIAIFLSMVKSVMAEEERVGTSVTQFVLGLANRIVPIFREGLTPESAHQAAGVILVATGADAVAITDRERILAHVGAGDDHHRSGDPVHTQATRRALETGEAVVAGNRDDLGCNSPECPLRSGVVVPLVARGKVLGTLKFYQAGEREVTPLHRELIAGMGQLLATHFELAELERLAALGARAELRALQAQVHPHFIFNTLNTIASLVRTDPAEARRLIIHLGDFLRRNLRRGEELVALEEELAHVDDYLAIQQARVSGRLQVLKEIDPGLAGLSLPYLTLQPLVENALKHGLFPKKGKGRVVIRVRRVGAEAEVSVQDDGVGMEMGPGGWRACAPPRRGRPGGCRKAGAGIGLATVGERLRLHFGEGASLFIESAPGRGCRVSFRLPLPADGASWHPGSNPESGEVTRFVARDGGR